MKINFKFIFFIIGLIILVLAKDKDNQITKITITTTEDVIEEEEAKEEEPIPTEKKNNEKKENVAPKNKRYNAQSNIEKMMQEAKKNAKETTTEKVLKLIVPYQDNEDYIVSPLGLGTPVNFSPLQVETSSYKTWVTSVLNENNPSTFSYNLQDSKTGKESGDWDTVVDEEGSISKCYI